jgi:hypothetical protein
MTALATLIEVARRSGPPKPWADKEAREVGKVLRLALGPARDRKDRGERDALAAAAFFVSALRLALSLSDDDLRACVPADGSTAAYLATRGAIAAAEEVADVLRGAHCNELAPKDAAFLCVALATTLVDLTGTLDLVLAPLNNNPPDPKAN